MSDLGLFDLLDDLSPADLRQRVAALRVLIAQAPVPIAIAHDPDCRVVSANRALASLLGVPPEANISQTPADGAVPCYRIQRQGQDLPACELPMQYAIAHRVRVSNEIELLRADGSVLYVQNDVEPLYDAQGRIYGCVSVCVDLTGRRLAEIALREADRRKDEFLAILSHELRTPLAPLRSALEVMRIGSEEPELVDVARATMERQLLQLVRITDDLMDVARIRQNRIELKRERLDLRAVLHSAVEASQPTIDAQQHSLDIQLPCVPLWAEADFTRLTQAFSNLLNNAAKYTAPGGSIRLAATSDAGTATIVVADNGLGIPPARLPHIFDLFTQLQEHQDLRNGGLGIGLTLAGRLVELHGGTIEPASEGPGRGSCFTVRLPLEPSRSWDDVALAPDRAPRGAACKVLVAEDDRDAAEMMRLMLGCKGHDVAVAADGEQAVALAETFQPAIAFLDIGMPRMDGHEAARRIRELLGARVVLVALTGWGQEKDKARSREAGFDHHVVKPPEPETLDRLIAAAADRET
jgi:PAS domain S-box-containing protein